MNWYRSDRQCGNAADFIRVVIIHTIQTLPPVRRRQGYVINLIFDGFSVF